MIIEPTDNVFTKIEKWGENRNFYSEEGATLISQLGKLMEEVGELSGNILRGKDVKDDIGDCVVVLTHIAKLAGTDIMTCTEQSYEEIQDRKGKFVKNVFIKEADFTA